MEYKSYVEHSFSKRSVNIQVDRSVWTSLRKLKKPTETFNDVILDLLNKRSKELSNSKVGAIEYGRKTDFSRMVKDTGCQYEYNDIKSMSNFIFDLKMKKIYSGKRTYNPGEFFGVEPKFFYLSKAYLFFYLTLIFKILMKEFGVKLDSKITPVEFESILMWRQLYYDYGLSEESFIEDIEKPLRKSEDKELFERFKRDIEKSPSKYVLF